MLLICCCWYCYLRCTLVTTQMATNSWFSLWWYLYDIRHNYCYLSTLCVPLSVCHMCLGFVHTSNRWMHYLGVQGVAGCFHVCRQRLVWELVDNWEFLLLSECLQQECAKLTGINVCIHHMMLQHELRSERMRLSVWVIQDYLLGAGIWCSSLLSTMVLCCLQDRRIISSMEIATEGMPPKNRKHHVVPACRRSEWQVEPH